MNFLIESKPGLSKITAVILIILMSCGLLLSAEKTAPEPTTIRYGHYERLEIKLPKAFAGQRDITLHLGLHDKEVLQAWGQLEGVSRIIDHFDHIDLKTAGGRLSGVVVMTVYDPEAEKIYRCRLELDARRSGGRLSGDFAGITSERGDELVFKKDKGILEPEDVDYFVYGSEISGDIDVLAMERAVPGIPVRFTLHTMHVLLSPRSMQKYVQLEFTLEKGRVTEAQINGRGENPWVGKIRSIETEFDGTNLRTNVVAYIAGDALEAGDYRIQLTGRIRDNLVIGTVKSSLNGKTIATEAAFGGQAIPIENNRLGKGPIYRFTLPTAREGRLPLLVYASRKKDKWQPGKAIIDWRLGRTMGTDLAKLSVTNSKLSGDLQVTLTPQGHAVAGDEPMDVVYSILTEQSEDGFAGEWRCQYGEQIESSGRLSGMIVSTDKLKKANAIRRDWPCWNGPSGNFTADSRGFDLTGRLEDAPLVWRSEQTPPGRCQTTRYGDGNISKFLTRGGPAGGSASPVIVEGKIFLAYPRPAGSEYHEKDLKAATGDRGRALGLLWKRKAEDVVLCIDAATGQTLWRTVFNDGLYRDHPIMGSSKIGVYSTNVTAAEGRVFARTTSGWTFALDVETGKVLWKSEKGGGIHRVVIGGVLVSSSVDLVGLDVVNGKVRWTVEDAGNNTAIPSRWFNGEKEYVIAGNLQGRISCVDPDDGKVMWVITDSGVNSSALTVGEGHLLANQQTDPKKPGRLGCYRISTKGYEKAWELSGQYPWKPSGHSPVICGEHVIVKTTVGGQGSRGDDLVVFDIDTGEPAGQITSNAAGSNGQTYWMDGKLISQADASHSSTPLLFYEAADVPKLRQLGDVWNTWHHPTSAYTPMLMTHALADGRIIIRGGRGLFCYDLRKQ